MHPCWSYVTGVLGGVNVFPAGKPFVTYTTTFSSVLFGPVTTTCVVAGGLCSFWQTGSFAMSIGLALGGLPSYLIVPLTVPAAAKLDRAIAALPIRHTYLVRIHSPGLLTVFI